MHPEPLPRRDAVVVDHPQRAKPHLRRLVIVSDGNGVMRVQPDVVGVAALVRPTDIQFSRCRVHALKMTATRDSAQCHVVGLSLPFGYAGRNGTPTTALLRGGCREWW